MMPGRQLGLPQVTRAERDPDHQARQHVGPIQHPWAGAHRLAQPHHQPTVVSRALQHRFGVPDRALSGRLDFEPAIPASTLPHQKGVPSTCAIYLRQVDPRR